MWSVILGSPVVFKYELFENMLGQHFILRQPSAMMAEGGS